MCETLSRKLRSIWIAVVLVAGGSDAWAEQRFALVIGSNAGWSQDRPLRHAEHAAERVRDALVSLGGFAADRAELLRDPDTADVRLALRRLARIAHDGVAEDTLVLVYYAGHADDQYLHLRGAPLSHVELQDTLRSLPATHRIAVIDACKSSAVAEPGARAASGFQVDVVSRRLSGMVVLTGGADERAQEAHAVAGSVFTHHLVSGLRGAADVNGDRQVTLAEAYRYADEQTRADLAPGSVPPRPEVHDELNGQGDLVLARTKAPALAQLRVAGGAPQHYVILDAHRWRLIAEVRAQLDREVVVALAPGSYRVERVLEDRVELAGLTLAAGGVADAAGLGYEPAPLPGGALDVEPVDLSAAERHEWARGQAIGALADGRAMVALGRFDQLLREVPDDMLAWRGRARALIRLAEAYQRADDAIDEQRALADALRSDPSLIDDPMFQVRYRRLGQLTAHAERVAEERHAVDEERGENPRLGKRFGIGVDLVSARGALAVTASAVLHRTIIASLAIDLGFPGLDLAVTFAPLPTRWSPYVGAGAHALLGKLGIEVKGLEPEASSNGRDDKEVLGAHARLELGAQYVGRSYTAELGFAVAAFEASDGHLAQNVMPVVHFGRLW